MTTTEITLPTINSFGNSHSTQRMQGLIIPNDKQTSSKHLTSLMNAVLQAPSTGNTGTNN